MIWDFSLLILGVLGGVKSFCGQSFFSSTMRRNLLNWGIVLSSTIVQYTAVQLSVLCKYFKTMETNCCRSNSCWLVLTLIGMRGDTFISLSFLNQILSADFLSKLSKLFSGYRVILTQDGHFSFTQRSCQLGLSLTLPSLNCIRK